MGEGWVEVGAENPKRNEKQTRVNPWHVGFPGNGVLLHIPPTDSPREPGRRPPKDHLGDEAEGEGPVGGQGAAGEGELPGHPAPHQAPQPVERP